MRDLAEVAYTAHEEEMHAASLRLAAALEADGESHPVGDIQTWDELDELETEIWVEVEAEFGRLVDAEPAPLEVVRYELQSPLEGPKKVNGEALPRGKWPKPAQVFDVRTPTAADCLSAEACDDHDAREFRIIFECMKPRDNGRWAWRHFEELDEEDLLEIRRLVLGGRERLEGRLYEAYRAVSEKLWAVDTAAELHPDDVEAFRALEQERDEPRPEVLTAINSAAAAEDHEQRARVEGPAKWLAAPSWEQVMVTGDPNRYVWTTIAYAMATATNDGAERLAMFGPDVPPELTPRGGMRAKELIAMRRGDTYEEKMVQLVASLCGVSVAALKRARVDDYERLFMAGRSWLGNRRGEKRAAKKRATAAGSAVSTPTSQPSPTGSASSMPSHSP